MERQRGLGPYCKVRVAQTCSTHTGARLCAPCNDVSADVGPTILEKEKGLERASQRVWGENWESKQHGRRRFSVIISGQLGGVPSQSLSRGKNDL